jgi:hypothetical protein
MFAASATAMPNQARPGGTGWTTHSDPAGFSIDTPAAWNISRDAQQGRIIVRGQRGEQAVVWPMFIDGQPLSAKGATSLVQRFAHQTDAQLMWRAAATGQSTTGNVVRMVEAGQAKSGAAMMTWSSATNGTTVLFYCVEAPRDVYRESADAFVGILKSFRVNRDPTGSTVAANRASTEAALQFVQWNEPHEHMFTITVPQGWRTLGGAYRLSAIDVRTGVLISSPDNRIRIVLGDSNIPGYISPSQMLAAAGLREGGIYGLGDGTRLEIRRYVSGQAYARLYAQVLAQKQCSSLQVASNNERRDLAETFLQAARAEGVPNPQITAGDASFTCTLSGGQVKGSMVAATIVPFSGPAPMWSVYRLYGYIAAPGSEPVAERVVARALDSLKVSPAWQAQQKQIAGNAVAADNQRSQQIQSRALAAIREDQQAINNTIVKGYEERSKVYDEVARRRENAILGTLDVVDPESGTRYKVSNYSDYHWMNNSGVIGGNNTGTSPGPDWRELITLP